MPSPQPPPPVPTLKPPLSSTPHKSQCRPSHSPTPRPSGLRQSAGAACTPCAQRTRPSHLPRQHLQTAPSSSRVTHTLKGASLLFNAYRVCLQSPTCALASPAWSVCRRQKRLLLTLPPWYPWRSDIEPQSAIDSIALLLFQDTRVQPQLLGVQPQLQGLGHVANLLT